MTCDELAVMLPVNRAMAKQMDWDMPFEPLLARLQELSKGRILDLEKGLANDRPHDLGERDWTHFLEEQTKVTDEWIDLFVQM